jgi:branched-subunit amino acid transport protein AzlD
VLIRFLGDHSPVGVMIALVGYTLRSVPWPVPAIALPALVSIAVTVGLQAWPSNLVLSLAVGTLVHIALASTLAEFSADVGEGGCLQRSSGEQ